MSNSLRITIDTRGLKRLKDKLTKTQVVKAIKSKDAKDVGDSVTKEMLKLISKGQSPIKKARGSGRFPAYKESYLKQIAEKEGIFATKKKTPVNLKLTGDFLKALTSNVVNENGQYVTEIFYEGKEDDKERDHRKGARGQRKRPTIPQGKEEFRTKIIREVEKIYKRALQRYLDKIDQ